MSFQIVHHMATLDSSPNPPNSLKAIELCLKANAAIIEVDITPLANDDFLLVHDPELNSETTGEGKVGECLSDHAKTYKLKDRAGLASDHPPALLSEVVTAYLASPAQSRLQLDYKSVYPSTSDEYLRRLANIIEPLGDRVIVSSGADWHLRQLKRLAPWLDVGFDIGFYLDWRDTSWNPEPEHPPYQHGVYDYYDDHVFARSRLLPTDAYLAQRCEMLLNQVPSATIWYVSHHLLVRALQDGFNMATWLHQNNLKLDAWTLDAGNPIAVAHAAILKDAGVDLFTTNTPIELAQLLTE